MPIAAKEFIDLKALQRIIARIKTCLFKVDATVSLLKRWTYVIA